MMIPHLLYLLFGQISLDDLPNLLILGYPQLVIMPTQPLFQKLRKLALLYIFCLLLCLNEVSNGVELSQLKRRV